MNKRTLFLLLVCSVALNLGFAGVYGLNMLNRPKAAPQAVPRAESGTDCPFASEYTHMYTTLGLNQAQLEHIEPLAKDFHAKAEVIGRQIVEQRDSIVVEMAREIVDSAALDAIHQDISTRQSEMQKLVVGHVLDMKQVMTPEQRNLFFESMRRSFRTQQIHQPLQ
ncbi:MAG: periplasmic heavy metal sensor [Deltaproteobacteria bacterium]|jgi:Spy/CpxP family protein refolding chaperone|nr:periplasmic heavy metal sensor [Deltaproteobacteria bacterium]